MKLNFNLFNRGFSVLCLATVLCLSTAFAATSIDNAISRAGAQNDFVLGIDTAGKAATSIFLANGANANLTNLLSATLVAANLKLDNPDNAGAKAGDVSKAVDISPHAMTASGNFKA